MCHDNIFFLIERSVLNFNSNNKIQRGKESGMTLTKIIFQDPSVVKCNKKSIFVN